jgi:hypothetical protein
MNKKTDKLNSSPPLLSWDLYSEWLYVKFGVPSKLPLKQEKMKIKKK